MQSLLYPIELILVHQVLELRDQTRSVPDWSSNFEEFVETPGRVDVNDALREWKTEQIETDLEQLLRVNSVTCHLNFHKCKICVCGS